METLSAQVLKEGKTSAFVRNGSDETNLRKQRVTR